LITANVALEMKKELFVAPNQLFSPNGAGSNHLISTKPVQILTHFDQLLSTFDSTTAETEQKAEYLTPSVALSAEEQTMVQLVHLHAHQALSQRSMQVELDMGELLSQLTLLEMKGVISQSTP
jgi:predicted Rossmann fold nucleotide-binding protein DprA/Smf involved in DNA uptake